MERDGSEAHRRGTENRSCCRKGKTEEKVEEIQKDKEAGEKQRKKGKKGRKTKDRNSSSPNKERSIFSL